MSYAWDLYIAYASADRAMAKHLYDQLRIAPPGERPPKICIDFAL